MTLLVVWNIERFSLSKIFNTDNTVPMGRVRSPQTEAFDRLHHILFDVFSVNPPDIFVVLELVGKTNDVGVAGVAPPRGSPATTAVSIFLGLLQGVVNPNYRVVPPILTGDQGYREGIAVFFNSATVQFAGPWQWGDDPAIGVGRSQAPGTPGFVPRAYRAPWNNALPAAQATFAGQWQFPAAGGGGMLPFPNNYNRSPFLTQFIDLGSPAPFLNRNIYLYSIHTSPKSTQPRLATRQIANIQFPVLGASDVTVVAGDFNLDSFDANDWAAYGPLLAAPRNFTCLLDPTAAGANAANCIPYFSTHLLRTFQATPYFSAAAPSATQNFYPRYGYMGKSPTSQKSGAIDNIFVRYNVNQPPHAAAIVNTIAGAPYTAIVPAPMGAPPAPALAANYPSALGGGTAAGGALPIPSAVAPVVVNGGYPPAAVPAGDPNVITFRDWANFQHIRSTSDHFAIVATI